MATKHEKKLIHEAKSLFGKMRKGSTLTRDKFHGTMEHICTFAASRGLQSVTNMNTKFVQALFEHLKEKGMSNSTLESYATTMRKIAHAIRKDNIMPKTNEELGIGRTKEERLSPKQADMARLAEIKEKLYQKGEWLGIAAEMREAFGLRAKESLLTGKIYRDERGNATLKIESEAMGGKPRYVDVAGTKGGRSRTLEEELRNEKQRAALDKLEAYLEKTSRTTIIPPDMTLKQAYICQRNHLHRLGATKDNNANSHVTRHARFQDMKREGATDEKIAKDAGHNRPEVVRHYIK